MTDTALIAALDRLAGAVETLAEEQRITARTCRDILAAITDPDQQSPVADALHEMGGRLEALEETQATLVPGVHEVVAVIRARAQQRHP